MFVKLHLMFVFLLSSTYGSKRLLLTDPDVVMNRLSSLETLVNKLNQQLTQQADTIKQQGETILELVSTKHCSSSYVHWGRTDCRAQNSSLVYSGYVAGGSSNQTGSSPDFVCLPPDPKLRATSAGSYDYGRIYGAEYATNFWGQHPNPVYDEIPCAVCISKHVSTTIMIPGKDTCYSGWKTEYHGFLGSSHHSHTSGSSFICVDNEHQSVPGGHAQHTDSMMVVNVKAHCGSLRCPPYTEGYSFTCVVCSK